MSSLTTFQHWLTSINWRWIPLPLIHFLHKFIVLMASFPMLITHFSIFLRNKMRMGMQKVYFQWHVPTRSFLRLQEVSYQLLVIICLTVSKKLCYYSVKSIPLFFSTQQATCIKCITSKQFMNLWSHKDSSLDFCFTKSWKLFMEVLQTCIGFVQSFYKLFH